MPTGHSAASICSSFSSQATHSCRTPASASRCSCPSPERKVGRRQARLPDFAAHTSSALVDQLDARVGSLHPRDERSSHLEFGWSRPHGANRRCHTPRLEHRAKNSRRNSACGLLVHMNNQVNPGQRASKISVALWSILKGLYAGLHFSLRSYYYLRRRSPGPPFPPDDRQAQGTGGYKGHFQQSTS